MQTWEIEAENTEASHPTLNTECKMGVSSVPMNLVSPEKDATFHCRAGSLSL